MVEKQNKVERPAEVERKNKNLVVTFRIFQAIFFGLFALGISMGLGDYSKFVASPISQLSIVTTVFGLIGSIITGILAKQSEKW